jgi:cation-transporting ATPase 13A3/4/5
MTIFHCLRICRAGLATNFHVFSMMILFSLIQFTTVCLLYSCYQDLTDSQMLYEDLFVTFPIFIALNLTKPSSKLSK